MLADLVGKVVTESEARKISEASDCLTATSAESGDKFESFIAESNRLKYEQ